MMMPLLPDPLPQPCQSFKTYRVLSRGRGRAGTTERIVGAGGRVNTRGQLGGRGGEAGDRQEEDEADGDHGGGGWGYSDYTTMSH